MSSEQLLDVYPAPQALRFSCLQGERQPGLELSVVEINRRREERLRMCQVGLGSLHAQLPGGMVGAMRQAWRGMAQVWYAMSMAWAGMMAWAMTWA